MSKKGFTLIEVVVVTLIIAALALLVVPSFKNSALTNRIEKAKVGLIELTTAVKLYNEDNIVPMTGVFENTRFSSLTANGQSGYAYLLNGNRWGHRPGSNTEYSLYETGTESEVLNCKYVIGDSTDATIMASVKCKFNKVDQDGTVCYRFYIEKNNPAVIKKETYEEDGSCDDL